MALESLPATPLTTSRMDSTTDGLPTTSTPFGSSASRFPFASSYRGRSCGPYVPAVAGCGPDNTSPTEALRSPANKNLPSVASVVCPSSALTMTPDTSIEADNTPISLNNSANAGSVPAPSSSATTSAVESPDSSVPTSTATIPRVSAGKKAVSASIVAA